MATIRSFEDLEIWKRARAFSKKVYELTLKGSFAKDFSLKDQINKSTGSIMDNIAEGFDRGGNKELFFFFPMQKDRPVNLDHNYSEHWIVHISMKRYLKSLMKRQSK